MEELSGDASAFATEYVSVGLSLMTKHILDAAKSCQSKAASAAITITVNEKEITENSRRVMNNHVPPGVVFKAIRDPTAQYKENETVVLVFVHHNQMREGTALPGSDIASGTPSFISI